MNNGMLASGLFSETTPHEIEVEICGSAGRVRLSCLRFDGFEFLPADAAPGPRDMLVLNHSPGGNGAVVCSGCLTVT